jgi:hypothetical protein
MNQGESAIGQDYCFGERTSGLSTLEHYGEHSDKAEQYRALARKYAVLARSHSAVAAEILEENVEAFELSGASPLEMGGDARPLHNQTGLALPQMDLGAIEMSDISASRISVVNVARHVVFPAVLLAGGLGVMICGIVLGEAFYCVAGTCGAVAGMAHLVGTPAGDG